jgi:hypothetical protein
LIAAAQVGGLDHIAHADHHIGDWVGSGHGISFNVLLVSFYVPFGRA